MSQVIRVAVSAAGAGWESDLLAEIDRNDRVQLVRRCVDIADLLATSATHRLDTALVAVSSAGLDASVVEQLIAHGVRIGAVEADGAHLGIGGPVRIGDLAAWFAETAEPVVGTTEVESGKIVAIWGPTGAPGRTSLAISLASATAAADVKTAIVDADVHGGAVGQWLGILDDVSGLMAACRDVTRGVPGSAQTHLLSLDERTNVLTGVPRPDMWHNLRPAAIESVLQQISASHELVVVDCAFGAQAATVPSADQITRRVLARLQEQGAAQD
ncbi:MAG TPA: hypothetical protein PLQ19_10900, partial [Aeromicrobium sp.]|nr:hypothetical protein [Aeromicrobium sp.]